MPKIKITYECDPYEDQEFLENIEKAQTNAAIIHEMDQWLRSVTKHGVPEHLLPSEEDLKDCKDEKEKIQWAVEDAYEKCREELWRIKNGD